LSHIKKILMEAGQSVPEPPIFPDVLPFLESQGDTWGPPSVIPNFFHDFPYQPFNKGERISRAADWTYTTPYQQRRGPWRGPEPARPKEDEFRLVETAKKAPKPAWGPRRYNAGPKSFRAQPFQNRNRQRWEDRNPRGTVRVASVDVKPDWKVVNQFPIANLQKARHPNPPRPDDVSTIIEAGSLKFYDDTIDRTSPHATRPIHKIDVNLPNVPTLDDPIIRELAGNEEVGANIFITDKVLSAIMSSARSIYSWDIVVEKFQGKVFFYTRENCPLDLDSVSENAHETPPDEKENINGAYNLSLEGTRVNQIFQFQALQQGAEEIAATRPNPFQKEGERIVPHRYRYRSFRLGDTAIVCRCEVDAAFKRDGSLVTVRGLLEHGNPAPNWRAKLETARGAVLANELKNNSFKIARWTTEALLAGTDHLRIAYISRTSRDNTSHTILSTEVYSPTDFAAQCNVSPHNIWGTAKIYFDVCVPSHSLL